MNKLVRFTLIIGLLTASSLLARHTVTAQEQRVLAGTAPTSTQRITLNETALSEGLSSIIQDNPGLHLSIAITDIQTSKHYAYGDPDPFIAASISKLLTATLVLQRIDSGNLSLAQVIAGSSTTIGHQLEKLIVESDNAAWHTFNALLTHEALRKFAESVGITDYNPGANTLRSTDAALLLSKLARGAILSTDSADRLFGYMSRANMRAYIVAGAPDGSAVYHKTGYLEDRLHDAAMLKKSDRSFVLVIFSKTNDAYNFSQGARVFKDITSFTSNLFFDT